MYVRVLELPDLGILVQNTDDLRPRRLDPRFIVVIENLDFHVPHILSLGVRAHWKSQADAKEHEIVSEILISDSGSR